MARANYFFELRIVDFRCLYYWKKLGFRSNELNERSDAFGFLALFLFSVEIFYFPLKTKSCLGQINSNMGVKLR